MVKKKRKIGPSPTRGHKRSDPAAHTLPRDQASSDHFLWPILLLAFILRVVFFKFSQDSPFFEPALLDAKYYHEWALRVARGDFGNGVFYGLPLYPYFLGLVYNLFHNSLVAAKFVQIFLGVGTVYFVYGIGREIANEKIAVLSALLAAVYGPLIFHEALMIPEALGVPLYTAAFYMTLRFIQSPSKKAGGQLGVLLGLALLTKAGILLFVLLGIGHQLFLARAAGRAKAPILFCLTAFALVIAPVTAHNVFAGKDFVWLTSHSGFNFYVGNNEKAEGVFTAPEGTGTNVDSQIEDSKAVAERESGHSLKPSEVSRYWSDKAWVFIRQHPAKFLELCARKVVLFFDSREISDIEDYQFASLFNPFLRIPWPNFSVLGPLFLLGLIMGRKTLRYQGVILLWVGSYLIGMMAFFVNARYRLPIVPILIPVAALGASEFCEDFVEWRLRKLLVAAGVLAAGFGLTQAHLVGTNFARDYVNAGDVWLEKDQPQRALPLYEKAIELDDRSSKACLAKALALAKMGRTDEAKIFYEKSLAIDPKNAQASNNLGLWYDQHGDSGKAEEYFLTAIELKPNGAQAHNNLGMVYGKKGEYQKAINQFMRAIELAPGNARSYTNLGLIYYQKGDKANAKELWQKALSVDPQFSDAERALQLLNKQ